MFKQVKDTEVTLLLDGNCSLGKTTIPLTIYYACKDILIRDQELTVSIHAGTDKDVLSFYQARSFTFPTEEFNDVSMVESKVLELEDFSSAVIV